MRISILAGIAALSFSLAAPALAQDAMSSQDQMGSQSQMASHGQMNSAGAKMSPAVMHKIQACNAMPHAAMMKSSSCAKVMKAHPDMMKSDDMMSSGH